MISHRPVGSVSSLLQDGMVGSRGIVARWFATGMVMIGLSSLGLALTPQSAVASDLCGGEGNGMSVAQDAISGQPDRLTQDICRILTMPTASRSEGEAFLDQVQPGSLLTHTSASAETMTLPSMWWTRDSIPPQLGRHRLVDAWLSYTVRDSELRVVDVMINGQFWQALTMPQRYGVLSSFGTSAQEFGYHLRFFQNNGYSARLIGLYSCEPEPDSTMTATAAARCLVTVNMPQILQLQQAMETQSESQTANDASPSLTGRLP